MAPALTVDTPSSAPLAEFFWIAGVDGSEILDIYSKLGEEYNASRSPAIPVTDTIEEDADAEVEQENTQSTGNSPALSNRNSYQFPKSGDESRLSFRSSSFEPTTEPQSNRSSLTIKGTASSNGTSFLSDADFDDALRKFASERDSFLTDLSLSAGAVVPSRPKPRPRTQKIVAEDVNPLKSSIGSVRRHMSFRDMSSMKRQPSLARQFIPVPQPLEMPTNMHPLKRKFEPVLLDRYPPKGAPDEIQRRGKFPDYIPMFAFPNDINIVSSDVRPRSTWHGFAMTGGDGSKLYGVCVTVWIPLNHNASDELEKRCEEWRRDNMTNEERELASSLGERLGLERAKLSRLLAQLPTVPSGSASRENLEDEISAVEEKIGLMADLLRPVRHGAASKIDGLTDGDTGFWIPRAYGILGKDSSMVTFWKEWLKAVTVPMMDGAILRVPPTSPRVGRWQPLERYVVNLCMEAFSPISSKTQVEISIRELRLFARKEAINELPGSRNTDLYPLFRALSVSNIIILFEYALAESRIIFLSSHISMLNLASKALVELLFPFQWTGVFIPILPSRLIQAIEAPCPYIVGIERRYENIEFPSDDFVLVDLDQDLIESTSRPTPLPRHQRRKLQSLLQAAAPLHHRYGVSAGPPAYAMETFPYDCVPAEIPSIYSPKAPATNLPKYVALNSASFGQQSSTNPAPIYNTFLCAKNDISLSRGTDRPSTSSTSRNSNPSSPRTASPTSIKFPQPSTPVSRNDSGFALQASLREKRSGHFDQASRRNEKSTCAICDERADEATYKCTGCTTVVHHRCAGQICLVCPVAFHPDQIRAAFVRCFASLLYTYKKFLRPASGDKKKNGLTYDFQMDAFLKSLPHEHAEYMTVLQQTQGFNEFIGERERAKQKSKDPRITLFDEIVLSKRNRGRSSFFSGRMTTDFLSDTTNHLWRSASASSFSPNTRKEIPTSLDWKAVVTRG
ncbi:dDENN domain-containing protein [Arthroderma uncinatum]|uniref:dDENN domain-containing protein n=1 Tax=Arthroderma uncinatum TaxID=74035 RepID=UPI00144ABB89|nr:dDENN domain-containing protein [Arthroderma uncinatum]KAF3491974.1 dDENN domain-containing protein [Arthroderma uncinatum]